MGPYFCSELFDVGKCCLSAFLHVGQSFCSELFDTTCCFSAFLYVCQCCCSAVLDMNERCRYVLLSVLVFVSPVLTFAVCHGATT